MTALPQVPAMNSGQSPESYFLLGGIERLTYDLNKGKAISAKTVEEAQKLIMRVKALESALAMRMQVIEDEE